MMDPKFQGSFLRGPAARANLYLQVEGSTPNWASTPAEYQVQAFKAVREAYPPAFSDPQFEMLRQNLEDPRNGPSRFLYSMDASMGATGLLTRGVVNAGRALGGAVTDVGQFFGIKPQPNRDNRNLDLEGLMLAGP